MRPSSHTPSHSPRSPSSAPHITGRLRFETNRASYFPHAHGAYNPFAAEALHPALLPAYSHHGAELNGSSPALSNHHIHSIYFCRDCSHGPSPRVPPSFLFESIQLRIIPRRLERDAAKQLTSKAPSAIYPGGGCRRGLVDDRFLFLDQIGSHVDIDATSNGPTSPSSSLTWRSSSTWCTRLQPLHHIIPMGASSSSSRGILTDNHLYGFQVTIERERSSKPAEPFQSMWEELSYKVTSEYDWLRFASSLLELTPLQWASN